MPFSLTSGLLCVEIGSAPAEGVLVFGGKGVAMFKLTCCVAVAVEPGEGQMGNVGLRREP